MLERDLIRALRLLAEPQIKPIAAARDSLAAGSQTSSGPPRFRARVEAALPDGLYRVSVAGQSLHLTLPATVRPGDTLELVHTGDPARPARTEEPARATLSETGRLLSVLARQPSAAPSIEATVAVPLLAAPPAGASDLAPRLRQALSQSGLFYESHQAEWGAGKRPLSDLLQEPQGRLSPAAAGAERSVLEAQTGLPEAEISQTSSRRQEGAGPVGEQTAPLVRQQLDTLDLRQIQWRGEIWPGQWMDWSIAEAPARDHEEPAARQWQTRLRLTLPRMGEISAILTLATEGITLDLEADPASAPMLRSGGPLLRDGLQAAGLPVLKWTVNAHVSV